MKEDLRDWCKSRCCNDSGSMIRDGALKKGLEDMFSLKDDDYELMMIKAHSPESLLYLKETEA